MSISGNDTSPIRFNLKRSNAMEFDSIDETMTFSTLKSEDSGIVLVNGLQSPDDEMKEILSERPRSTVGLNSRTSGTENGINNSSRRRSSAGTYSSVEDEEDDNVVDGRDDQQEGLAAGDGGHSVLLNDDSSSDTNKMHEIESNTCQGDQSGVDDVNLEMCATGTEGDRLSAAGCNSGDHHQDNAPLDLQAECKPPKVERPRIDFQKGLQCNDVWRAIDILMTSYRLPDVTQRDQHRKWSLWGPTDFRSRSYYRGHYPSATPEGSKELKEICHSIERRHREIAEILQKLLELDAANKVEAENLLRLAANAGCTAGDGGSPGADPGNNLVNPTFSASGGVADKNASNDGEDENVEGKSRSLKRRNPFMRAAHAIRKRFSRTSQSGEPVPVAA